MQGRINYGNTGFGKTVFPNLGQTTYFNYSARIAGENIIGW